MTVASPFHGDRQLWHAAISAPRCCMQICKVAPFLGGRPYLDPALRRRPEFITDVYSQLFVDGRVSAARFSLWSFIDASFRYTGTVSFVQNVWLHKPLPLDYPFVFAFADCIHNVTCVRRNYKQA